MKANAVVAVDNKKVEIREVEIGTLGEWDIQVELETSAISVGTESYVLSTPERYERPYIPGYSPIGRVVVVGEKAAERFAVGDRVTYFQPRAPLDVIQNCGGHQSPAIVNVDPKKVGTTPSNAYCEKVPPDLQSDTAAYGGIASISCLGISLARQSVGDRAFIIGQGMIGQLAAQYLRLRGAEVAVADLHEKRLSLSRQSGADYCMLAGTNPVADELLELWPEGADIVVDCTGSYRVVESIAPTVKVRGKFIFLGWCKGTGFNLELFHGRVFEAYFPWGLEGPRISSAWRLMKTDTLKIPHLITHRFHVRDAPKAYELIYRAPAAYVGILLDWR